MVGKYIHDSELINNAFTCRYVSLTLATNISDIGKPSIRKAIDYLKQYRSIRRQARDFQPDLIYVTPNATGGAFYKDFFIVQMLKRLTPQVIVHYHNKGIRHRQDKTFDNRLYRHFFKNLKVILIAKPLYIDVKKYVSPDNVYFCPNGIPLSPNTQHPTLNTQHPALLRILFLSNMIESKGVWTLLSACQQLRDQGCTFQCDYVGNWSDVDEKTFNNQVAELKLGEQVKAHGGVYGDDRSNFFNRADVFVLPTYYPNECFPLVLLEAMQHGIPCISTNEGAITDIIDDGQTGFIIPANNPSMLADKLQFLSENPKQRKEMGQRGYLKFKDNYTINHFETRLLNILHNA
ncbi:MAG: glycosyltransferase family 4 protein [Prevotella sp.]|nr:glycosyltransferase family 4 protein [Prevotella sp.]